MCRCTGVPHKVEGECMSDGNRYFSFVKVVNIVNSEVSVCAWRTVSCVYSWLQKLLYLEGSACFLCANGEMWCYNRQPLGSQHDMVRERQLGKWTYD